MAQFILKDSKGKEQTFDHDKIFVRDEEGNLLPFTHGTGTSTDVRYVTFMSYDGLVEYGKKAVAVGDDCADPIARGVFGTPTRESDAQYNYTFYGWATEPNGGAVTNWNKSINEDKTVYANFASAVRYYTITYYDSDGTTVLKTESLAYGAMPSYAPTKSGYDFAGWNLAPVSVTGDASYTATWTEEFDFATASWARIAEISESGEADKYMSVGDTKTITLNFSGTTEDIPVRIVGFNHDDKSNGTGKAGISFMLTKGVANNVVKLTENTSYGTGYEWGRSLTTTLLNSGAVWTALPVELRNVIKMVKKTSNSGYGKDYGPYEKNTLFTVSCKVWLPSTTELGADGIIDTKYVALGQGEQYEYYTPYTKGKLAKKNSKNVNTKYACRSMQAQYACSSVCVNNDGSLSNGAITTVASGSPFGRVFGFCV